MVLLRAFSRYKNTYFKVLSGSQAVITDSPTNSPATKTTVNSTIPGLLSEHRRTGVPVQALALKAFWLASSPGGVKNIINKQDARITAFAAHWKAENGAKIA